MSAGRMQIRVDAGEHERFDADAFAPVIGSEITVDFMVIDGIVTHVPRRRARVLGAEVALDGSHALLELAAPGVLRSCEDS